MEEMFVHLEDKLDRLVKLVAELKERNRALETEVENLTSQKEEAVKRINFMVDKISGVV